MPIPQDTNDLISEMKTTYDAIKPYFDSWCQKNDAKIKFIDNISLDGCHLDPDFDCSTYGDQVTGRGLRVRDLKTGDCIVFFASFKPISECGQNLIYALYGMMVVDKVLKVSDIPEKEFFKNAHTRVKK